MEQPSGPSSRRISGFLPVFLMPVLGGLGLTQLLLRCRLRTLVMVAEVLNQFGSAREALSSVFY